jgi:hypothetical protein
VIVAALHRRWQAHPLLDTARAPEANYVGNLLLETRAREESMQHDEVQEPGTPSNEAKAALARVATAISDPDSRKSFSTDPYGTVQGYETLPQSVRDTLERLSPEELDQLAHTHQALEENGFYIDVEDEHGGGRLTFF